MGSRPPAHRPEEKINKGAAVQALVEGHSYAAILVVGDDQTDESMFTLNLPHMVSIHVGDRPSAARHSVPSPAALRALLHSALR